MTTRPIIGKRYFNPRPLNSDDKPGSGRLYRLLLVSLVPGMAFFAFVAVVRFTPLVRWGNTPSTSPLIAFPALLSAIVTILLGFLIIRRAPGNVCGPLLVLFGVGSGNLGLNETLQNGYGQVALQFVNNTAYIWVLVALFVYFPDGTAARPWAGRLLAWLTLPLLVITLLGIVTVPRFESVGEANPLYLEALTPLRPASELAFGPLLFASLIASVIAFFRRYRTSVGHQRQQMRWFMFCASTLLVLLLAWLVGFAAQMSDDGIYYWVLIIVSDLALPLIPTVGIGVGILRHRLYDVDVIIRRTLVYTTLTIILAVLYWGGVVVLQALLRPVTGGANNDLAIVGTTLLVAGIFFPLRRVVQNFIDHRFYRRKYDAARTLAAFAAHARDEVELTSLAGHLLQVVDETMKPASVSLWLREVGADSTRVQS